MLQKVLKYVIVVLAAALVVLLAALLIPNKKGPSEPGTNAPETDATTEAPETTEPETTAPEETTEPETTAPETTEPETIAPETTAEPKELAWDIAFVGDSRTVFMGTAEINGVKGAGILPESALFATYGGQLVDDSAFENAENAALSGRHKAVFWYGVNDVQMNPERENADVFVANYDRVIEVFHQWTQEMEIIFLSVVDAAADEKDYYPGQRENVAAYNEALKAYAEANGYTFIDLTPLAGENPDEWMLPDRIHFTDEFYAELLPFLREKIGF